MSGCRDHIDFMRNLRRLASAGYGTHNIGAILGCADQTVRRYAAMYGIEVPKRTRSGLANWSGFPPEALAKAAALRWRYVEWSGGRERLIDAAARLGITVDCLRARLHRWDVEKAMSLPKQPANRSALAAPIITNRRSMTDAHDEQAG